jgi:type VI secretion system protein ImpK
MTAMVKSDNVALTLPFFEAPDGFFRSKLFVSRFSTNPIFTAASPLLCVIERLNQSHSLPCIDTIRQNIAHELDAFHCKLISQKLPESLIYLAKYLLSATIDELIGKNYLRTQGESLIFAAFTPPSIDNIRPESHFFYIISQLKENPNQYLDLIELAYFCLLAGFEGQYHQQANGRTELDNLIESLYQLITTHRVKKPLRLIQFSPAPLRVKNNNNKPWLVGALLIGMLSLSFLISHSLIEKKATSVLFGYHSFKEIE